MTTQPRALRPRRARQAGFTLIEALVALLVMAFGMLSIAGMQATLSRNADIAKQRSEAVRIAQLTLEELRSYDALEVGAGSTYTYAVNVVDSVVTDPLNTITPTNSNTTFTRSWTVMRDDGVTAAVSGDAKKWIHVTVTWPDRAGDTQSVLLSSIIARNNPAELKGQIAGQVRPKVRFPKNRSLNIPYPAVSTSVPNRSAFIPPPGNVAYVFDNATGNIVSSCAAPAPVPIQSASQVGNVVTVLAASHPFYPGNEVTIAGEAPFNGTFIVTTAVTGGWFTYNISPAATAASLGGGTASLVINLVEGVNLATSGLICTADFTTPKYLLSGYVRFALGGSPDADDAENPNGATLNLHAITPLVIDASVTGNGPATGGFTCYAQRQKVVSAANVNASAIVGLQRTNGVVTVTMASSPPPGFLAEMRIAIKNAAQFGFEGSFKVESVSGNTLTFLQPGTDASAGSGGSVELIQQITLAETDAVPGPYAGQAQSTFVAYACVVTPVDPDGIGAEPAQWWGQVNLMPAVSPSTATWLLGNTYSTAAPMYKVCRYTGNYIDGDTTLTADNDVSNAEHPLYYRRVTGALDGQNYLVIRGDAACPGDVPVNFFGSVSDLFNTNTAFHQDGTATAAELSFQCTNPSCGSGQKVYIEPPSATTPIPMVCAGPVAVCGPQ